MKIRWVRMRYRSSVVVHSVVLVLLFFAGFAFSSAPWTAEQKVSFASEAPPWSWPKPYLFASRCERVWFPGFQGSVRSQKMPGPFRAAGAAELRFLEFNMHNLFERDFANLDGRSRAERLKSEEMRSGLARVIKKSDPDVMTWVEVENARAAQLFNEKYLQNKYEVFLFEGNDSRGIDVALLVKKDLPFEVEYRSLRDLKTPSDQGEIPVFSRDLSVAVFRRLDTQSRREAFILMSTHFKSQRGDNGSFDQRLLQSEASAQATQLLKQEFGADVPIILTGDFNNHLPVAKEFQPLWQAGYRDAFDLANIPVGSDQRVTHFFFPFEGAPRFNQLDGFLLSGKGMDVKGARVIPHLDKEGRFLPPPRNFQDRETRPSDHQAVEMTIQFQ